MADSAFRTRSDVRFRVVDREAVVLRQEAGEALVLNEVGARILQLLAEGVPEAELGDLLAAEFEIDATRAASDAEAFVAELTAGGVLEAAPPPIA